MNIKLKGRYFTQKERLLLVDLAQWCAIKLLGEKLSNEINLTIHLIGPELWKEDAFYATTEVALNDSLPIPKNFLITISNKFKILRTLIVLAHEMVHVKQHALGELKYRYNGEHTRWKDGTIDDDSISYWDLPWEIEAHGREKGLLHQWASDRKLTHANNIWYRDTF